MSVKIQEVLLRNKKTILLITLISTALSVAAYFIMPTKYEATIVVSYSPPERHGKNSGISSSLASLASLSGLGMNASENNPRRAVAILKSRHLTQAFMKEQNLLPKIYPELWDSEKGKWKDDAREVPTYWKSFTQFNEKIRSVNYDMETGLIVLTMKWKDKNDVSAWANKYIEAANLYFRKKDIAESQNNLKYLNKALEEYKDPDIRMNIATMIKEELKTVMVAQWQQDYAFKVVDPAVTPEKKSSPILAIMLFMGVFLGLLSGSMFCILREALRGK